MGSAGEGKTSPERSPSATKSGYIYTMSSETLPARRRLRGIVDLVAGLTIIAAYIVLLQGQVAEGTFEPGKHFAYLTNQTSYSNIVVLLAGGVLALTTRSDTVVYASVRASFVAYAFVVGVVYNALLRDPDDFGFHNEVTHVAIPIYLMADWLIRGNRPWIGWNTVWVGASYPLVWVFVTLIRGPYVNWYPYDFLDPTQPAGWVGVIAHVIVVTGVFVALIAFLVWLNHLHSTQSAQKKPLLFHSHKEL